MHSPIRLVFRPVLLGFAFSMFASSLSGCLTPKMATVPDDDGGSSGSGSSSYGGSGSSGGGSHVNGTGDGGGGNSQGDGSTGGNNGGGDANAPPMRGPTPATTGHNFPFPQNRQVAGCIYPAGYQNSDVVNAYAKWKADLVVSDGAAAGHRRVQRTQSDPSNPDGCTPPGSTVSEGIGYGMLIAAYMDDQSLFDDLWLYEQANLDSMTQLMNWAPGPGTTGMDCSGPASDADEDMAFALLMADKQWGGQGAIGQPYLQVAVKQIQAIWQWEVTQWKWLAAGKTMDRGGWATVAHENPSYFAPAYYRAFAKADPSNCAAGADVTKGGCDGWSGVIDQSYTTINDALGNGNGSNGLIPAWCNDSSGSPCKNTGASDQPFYYQYDSCRAPFRIGLDACWNAYGAAQTYVGKTSSFFAPIGAAQIVDGYNLDGSQNSAHSGHSAAFVGPAAVGAMSVSADQGFVNDAYTLLAQDNAFIGGEYYESSWTVMSLLMLTGNFLDYTQEAPAH
jgi:endo-1,4-beta-D-glucanase Y